MPITKITLKGFRRTFLNNIKDLTLTFTSPLQIVLGTNGSGKTSLVRQFSPLPPDPKEFFPGGSKCIEYQYKGSEYILTSQLKQSFKNSFVKDGEELNPGGTTKVQLELVKRYFGLTPALHELLVGSNKFCSLSINERRELFTSLAPVDLTYALQINQKLKQGARDTQGAIKHIEGRLAAEKSKLASASDLDELVKTSETLTEELNLLMSNRQPGLESISWYAEELEALMHDISVVNKQALAIETSFDPQLTPEVLEQELYIARQALAGYNARRSTLLEQLEKLTAVLHEVANHQGVDKVAVEKRRNELLLLLQNTPAPPESLRNGDIKIALEELCTLKPKLLELLVTMPNPAASELSFERAEMEGVQQRLVTATDWISSAERRLGALADRHQHLTHSDKVECPQCSAKFVPDSGPGELEAIVAEASELEEKIEQAKRNVEVLLTTSAIYDSFNEALLQLRRLASGYPRLTNLWERFASQPWSQTNTKALADEVCSFEELLIHALDWSQTMFEYNKADELLATLASTETQSIGALTAQVKELEDVLEADKKAADKVEETIRGYEELKSRIHLLLDGKSSLLHYGEKVNVVLNGYLQALRNNAIDKVISGHQNQLALINKRVSELNVAKALIKDLEQQLAVLKENEKAFKALLDELSPTNGLIAEQLTGFIAQFVGMMNLLVERIWNYEFVILPCGLNDGELDYKFPMEIADEKHRADDVSCGSEAQRHLVDIVFKLALVLYLGQPDWPLYLDEVGREFDEVHRQKVMQFIKEYVEAGKALQAFLISHYASNHTAFSDAEIAVLDPNNITVPTSFNGHVNFC